MFKKIIVSHRRSVSKLSSHENTKKLSSITLISAWKSDASVLACERMEGVRRQVFNISLVCRESLSGESELRQYIAGPI